MHHDLFRTLLSYLIHFSSSINNRFRNVSISSRFSKELQMFIRSIKLFVDNSCGTPTSLCRELLLNGTKAFDWRCYGSDCSTSVRCIFHIDISIVVLHESNRSHINGHGGHLIDVSFRTWFYRLYFTFNKKRLNVYTSYWACSLHLFLMSLLS